MKNWSTLNKSLRFINNNNIMHTIMFKAMFLPLSYFDSYNNLLSSMANVGLLATPPESE